MKNIFALTTLALSIAAVANGIFSTTAHAAPVTGDVQIKANVPEIVFLETYKDITFNLEAKDLTTDTPGLIQTASGSFDAAAATKVTPALAATTVINPGKTFAGVQVYRTWGTGGPTAKIKHGASLTSPTLTHSSDTTSTMTLTAAKAAIDENAPGLDSTKALTGSMDFTFSLGNVKAAGSYAGATLQVSAEGI